MKKRKLVDLWRALAIWLGFMLIVALGCCFFIEPIIIPVNTQTSKGSVNHDFLIIGRPSASGLLMRATAADIDGRYKDALKDYCLSMDAYDWSKLPEQVQTETKRIVYYRTHGCTAYFPCLASSGFLSRWDKDTLNVFIPTGKSGFSPQIHQIILDAFTTWGEVADIPKIKEIPNPNSAHLLFVVKQKNSFSDQREAGTRESGRCPGYSELIHQSQKMDIFIPNADWETLNQNGRSRIKSLCLHEIGHALGLEAHSIFGDDIMFYSCMVNTLSPRDKEAIKQLYQKNAIANIERTLHEEAKKDNPYALMRLGMFYHQHGQSNGEYDCYRKAATLNVPEAQAFIGEYYETGHLVEQNYQKAIEWYRRSANNGCAFAQGRLGYLYENGLGVDKDPAMAVSWYHRAAELGNSKAEYRLGMCYATGCGVKKDMDLAKKWLSKSAASGNSDAQQALAKLD